MRVLHAGYAIKVDRFIASVSSTFRSPDTPDDTTGSLPMYRIFTNHPCHPKVLWHARGTADCKLELFPLI